MSKVKVKICGITNLEDTLKIAKLKPDALGFVFYKKSPRYVSVAKALQIIWHLPRKIKKVGVFVNEKENNIKDIASSLKLDILQFHGDESPEFCKRFKNYKVLKSIRIKDKFSLKNIKRNPVWGILFDTYNKNLFGGTGKKFNWDLIRDIKLDNKKIFLSGGLNVKNVKSAIKVLKPDWVDVSSSVEIRPGKKDINKVKKFIEIVRKSL
jgi:phosphoribosylanthranilate isomerase